MKFIKLQTILFLSLIIILSSCAAKESKTSAMKFSLKLDLVNSYGNNIFLDVGIGSGAFRDPKDRKGVFYVITDRGPNFDTKESAKLLNIDYANKRGKVFPVPSFAPSIYKLEIKKGKVKVLQRIQLKKYNGTQITGISNPFTEYAWDINGSKIEFDPSGIDSEGIVKLSDGAFWIADEYGPSIVHVEMDGRIIDRWVPKGVAQTLKGAGYKVTEKLPGILRQRPLNRGIEGLSVSPDEKFLYFAMQSPLANPDKNAFKKSRNLRIFKIDREKDEVIGEFVYIIDTPETFAKDSKKKKRDQNDVKVSEITCVGQDKLVVLERISKTSKFYLVDLNSAENILNSKWDKAETKPSLEATDKPEFKTLKKQLLLNSDDKKYFIKKIEGLAWFGGDKWLMINDNDFGIFGDKTKIIFVKMPVK